VIVPAYLLEFLLLPGWVWLEAFLHYHLPVAITIVPAILAAWRLEAVVTGRGAETVA